MKGYKGEEYSIRDTDDEGIYLFLWFQWYSYSSIVLVTYFLCFFCRKNSTLPYPYPSPPSPWGETIPTTVPPTQIDDSIPTEEEVKLGVQKLRGHRLLEPFPDARLAPPGVAEGTHSVRSDGDGGGVGGDGDGCRGRDVGDRGKGEHNYFSWCQVELTSTWNPHTPCIHGYVNTETYPRLE